MYLVAVLFRAGFRGSLTGFEINSFSVVLGNVIVNNHLLSAADGRVSG